MQRLLFFFSPVSYTHLKDQQGFIVEANLNKAVENGAQTFFGCFGTKLLKEMCIRDRPCAARR